MYLPPVTVQERFNVSPSKNGPTSVLVVTIRPLPGPPIPPTVIFGPWIGLAAAKEIENLKLNEYMRRMNYFVCINFKIAVKESKTSNINSIIVSHMAIVQLL